MEHQTLGRQVICPTKPQPAYYIVDCRLYGQPNTTHSLAPLHCDWLNIWISGATVLRKKCKWSWLKPGRCVCLTTGEDWVELILLVHYVCARLGALYSVLVGAQSQYIEVARWGISIRTSPNLILFSKKNGSARDLCIMTFGDAAVDKRNGVKETSAEKLDSTMHLSKRIENPESQQNWHSVQF